jgi:hypothetical protein
MYCRAGSRGGNFYISIGHRRGNYFEATVDVSGGTKSLAQDTAETVLGRTLGGLRFGSRLPFKTGKTKIKQDNDIIHQMIA